MAVAHRGADPELPTVRPHFAFVQLIKQDKDPQLLHTRKTPFYVKYSVQALAGFYLRFVRS